MSERAALRWTCPPTHPAIHGIELVALSAEQAHYAAAHSMPGVDIQVRDWLANELADASADAAWAIESSEHIVDKDRCPRLEGPPDNMIDVTQA